MSELPAAVASGSKTIDGGPSGSGCQQVRDDRVLKTNATQCGGEHVDDENIVVGKLSFSPLPEVESESEPEPEPEPELKVKMEPADDLNEVSVY